MKAREIMSENPVCCSQEDSLLGIAMLMKNHDCGAIPVLDDMDSRRVVGVVTDRDIVIRSVANEQNPLEQSARDCMTVGVATVDENAPVEDVVRAMESLQVRRMPVVNEKGCCVGIISQADIARNAGEGEVANFVREVSIPPLANMGL